jgi:hypothetical protein
MSCLTKIFGVELTIDGRKQPRRLLVYLQECLVWFICSKDMAVDSRNLKLDDGGCASVNRDHLDTKEEGDNSTRQVLHRNYVNKSLVRNNFFSDGGPRK